MKQFLNSFGRVVAFVGGVILVVCAGISILYGFAAAMGFPSLAAVPLVMGIMGIGAVILACGVGAFRNVSR